MKLSKLGEVVDLSKRLSDLNSVQRLAKSRDDYAGRKYTIRVADELRSGVSEQAEVDATPFLDFVEAQITKTKEALKALGVEP